MQALTAAAENAERALWHAAGQRTQTNAGAVTDPAALAQTLPADGLLIAYTEALDAQLAHQSMSLERPVVEEWFAFTLARGGQAQLHRIGNIRELTAQARAWYADLRNPSSDLAQLRRDGDPLRRALLDPLLAGNEARHLFIVPEGELFRISFAALP